MNTPTPAATTPAEQGGTVETLAGLNAFTAAMADAPHLGHILWYSVFEPQAPVSRDQLELWFRQLGLDETFLPPAIRQIDAFEQITGPRGVHASYRLAHAHGEAPVTTTRRRNRRDDDSRTLGVTLMIRHVSREDNKLVRNLVREVRDENASELEYDPRLATIEFWRDPAQTGVPGAGVLNIEPNETAIALLCESEQAKVRAVLDEVRETYAQACRYYTTDRLRAVVRTYVEGLSAVKVRPSGGVYFVHRYHDGAIDALKGLVDRLGGDSELVRVPLPDTAEQRDMVVRAITTKAKEDLQKLAADIATANRDGATEAHMQGLVKRFQELQKQADEHERMLATSLGETQDALKVVHAQVSTLLVSTW
ncbi:hypothetical protein F5972_08425 [Microbispora cellulosiformans]|uniref:Uncharacterized protein n=1 Tax=Microbispora cellulosiformans TaxID=2614688 RepID=A0A5J5K797_9ACTN|nr:DUF6744 family protein [Microbispora cellulosiformans]KAA9379668.1 hypothetical protein F5972_08425 [Microbispora cellulosiformans]